MIEVIQPGLHTTVQDLGREGYAQWGVSPAGAADAITFRAGNLLLGNKESAAGFEFTLAGGHFRAETDIYVLVAGDAPVHRDGASATAWRRLRLGAGQELSVGEIRSGLRAYLCVAGGLDVPLWLGSAATHTPSGLGGWHGRALRKGDMIPVGHHPKVGRRNGLPLALREALKPRNLLHVTRGPHAAWLRERNGDDAASWLESAPWRVLPASNRMGLRLTHAGEVSSLVDMEGAGEILSVGVPCGAIQATPSGQLLVLGVDAQTTGGYPIAASVVSADLSALGQLRPGDALTFKVIGMATARQLLLKQEALLSMLREAKESCRQQRQPALC